MLPSLVFTETATRLLVSGERDILEQLHQAFRYHPDNYYRADSYQLWKATKGTAGWDGYRYPFMVNGRGKAEVLRGRKDEVLAKCREWKVPISTRGLLESPFAGTTAADIPDDLIKADFSLDPRQKEAIAAWLSHGMGLAHHSVNAGKTSTLAAAAVMVKRKHPDARFLYYTPSERLVKQVLREMHKFLPDWDIGQFGGGKHNQDAKDMVVATQAMLARHHAELVDNRFFSSFFCLLIDESHHAASASAKAILLASSAFYRFSASASLRENDPDRRNDIAGLCGPVRSTVTMGELIEEGRSAKPHLYLVDVLDWQGKYRELGHEAEANTAAWVLEGTEWVKAVYLGPVYKFDERGRIRFKMRKKFRQGAWVAEKVLLSEPDVHHIRFANQDEANIPASAVLLNRRYDKCIIRFKERNALIVDWVRWYSVEKQWPTVVVATRTPHIVILHALIARAIGQERVRALHGQDTARDKDSAFQWLAETPGAVLVTSLVKEGISISAIRAGVVADVVADYEVATQILGRFIRQKEENTAHLTWFVDRQHPKYAQNAADLFGKLAEIEGLTFYHPVSGPNSIGAAEITHGRKTHG